MTDTPWWIEAEARRVSPAEQGEPTCPAARVLRSLRRAAEDIRARFLQRGHLTRWDLSVAVLLFALGSAHYLISTHNLWLHVALFWLFQVPVLIGAISRGLRGGLAVALLVTLTFIPHAVGLSRIHGLDANSIWMHVVSLYIVGLTTGWLRDRWRREEVMGERLRELRSLSLLVDALRRDLQTTIPALDGIAISIRSMEERTPGLKPAVRAMNESLECMKMLLRRLQVLRIDARIGLVRLDWVVTSMLEHVKNAGGAAPRVVLDWQCAPLVIPASATSLGSALAVLACEVGQHWTEVRVSISRVPGQVEFGLHPSGIASASAPPAAAPQLAVFEMACQVVRAHGGWVERDSSDAAAPCIRVGVPSALRVRAAA